MITVPKSDVVRAPRPKVEDKFVMMAAATMHAQGRLVEPVKEPDGDKPTDSR